MKSCGGTQKFFKIGKKKYRALYKFAMTAFLRHSLFEYCSNCVTQQYTECIVLLQ